MIRRYMFVLAYVGWVAACGPTVTTQTQVVLVTDNGPVEMVCMPAAEVEAEVNQKGYPHCPEWNPEVWVCRPADVG